LPPNCLNELQEATFGKDNQSSSLVYSIKPDISNSLASTTEFSFLVRTNKQNGQIFYIGGQNLDDDTNTFISCDVQNGTLSLKSRLGGKTVQQIRGRRKIDDNLPHLVEIRRKDNNFTMNLDNVKEGNLVITRPFAHPLIVDRIVLGDAQSNQTENSTLFKGTLQDVRVNDLNLPLGESSPSFLKPNQTIGNQLIRQNLLMGTVSDDLCAEKPCLRGTCENTFNDYVCTCQKGYMGKNCNLIDYCSSSPCASGIAQCVNTHGGYICKAPATFAKTSQSKFVLKQSADQVLEPRFSFAIRTRSSTARVFKINTLNESLWMELKGESVIFHYTNQSNTIDDPLSVELNNGQWHSIELIESGDGHLSVSFDNSSVPLLSPFSLTRFLGGNDSWLTFGRSQNETGFKGCVHNVRFGDLPDLSFFSLTESGTLSLNGTRHFEVKSLQNIRSDGCHSKDLCNPVNPCRNSGLCKDLFNLRKCECAPGWEGEYCEINIDECVNNKDCGSNGQCVDGINSFSCACRDGFGGPFCSIELDQCVSKPCKNNGKCSTVDGRAVCECSDNFIGQFCTQKRSVKCSDNPCAINNTLGCTDTEVKFIIIFKALIFRTESIVNVRLVFTAFYAKSPSR
jgi:protein crumbs